MIARAKRRPQDLTVWFDALFESYRGKRVKISGSAVLCPSPTSSSSRHRTIR